MSPKKQQNDERQGPSIVCYLSKIKFSFANNCITIYAPRPCVTPGDLWDTLNFVIGQHKKSTNLPVFEQFYALAA